MSAHEFAWLSQRGEIGWLRGVREYASSRDGAVKIGQANRPVFVGQAPPCGRELEPALSGDSGRRLFKAMGLKEPEFREHFDAFNILPMWPGSSGEKGDLFPLADARTMRKQVVLRSSCAILLGGAAAFGVNGGWFVPHKLEEGVLAYAVPHPSGVNRWWSDPRNRASARHFLHRICIEAHA